MKVSIIIPTHNRRELLLLTLQYLFAQEKASTYDSEILVVDDASTDGTEELVRTYQSQAPKLLYVPHARNHYKTFCPASVRNAAAKQSAGDILVFLDCGVLVPPGFVKRIVLSYTSRMNQVILHYTAGLSAILNESNQQKLANLSPETLCNDIQTLLQDGEWIDPREGLFQLVDHRLDSLCAPWILAWTCALSVPRTLFEQVGGFDETFQQWGGEDTDFGFRLYQTGASFVADSTCIALHLPHEKLPLSERLVTNRDNRRKTHRKAYTLDTELHVYYAGVDYNQVLSYYKQLVLLNTLPLYSSRLLATLREHVLQSASPSLLIGTDSQFLARNIPTTHHFVCNLAIHEHFQRWFPQREIKYLLGCDTPYSAKYFQTIILTDFIRLLPDLICKDLLQEMARIGTHIYWLYTAKYVPFSHKIDETRWKSFAEISSMLSEVQLQISQTYRVDGTTIFQIRAC